MSRGAQAAKRGVDIVLGSLLLLLVLPAILIGTIGCAIALRTWPFFSQTRIGKDGEPFRIVKLRTLPKSFPRYAPKRELGNAEIPWFARTLRMLHLDELPQLALVVTGKMSLVGPRPEMPYLHATFDPSFARARSSVRPGCTGAWQISEHCQGMIDEHPEYDELYVAHRSARLDFWIILRSLRLLLPFGRPRLVAYDELAAKTGAPAVPARVKVSSPAMPAAEMIELSNTRRVTPLDELLPAVGPEAVLQPVEA